MCLPEDPEELAGEEVANQVHTNDANLGTQGKAGGQTCQASLGSCTHVPRPFQALAFSPGFYTLGSLSHPPPAPPSALHTQRLLPS